MSAFAVEVVKIEPRNTQGFGLAVLKREGGVIGQEVHKYPQWIVHYRYHASIYPLDQHVQTYTHPVTAKDELDALVRFREEMKAKGTEVKTT